MNKKVDAYIGFAVKRGSVVHGLDSLEYYRKKVYLVIYTSDLAENSVKKLKEYAARLNAQTVVYDSLGQVLNKNTKVLAITNKELATAIQNNIS